MIFKSAQFTAKRLQTALAAGTALITLYFTYQLSKELFTYTSLTSHAPARILQWEIEEDEGRFALKGVYSFEIQEKIWRGSSRLLPPYYWNEPAAVAALKMKGKESRVAWYNPKNPSHSALERAFPSNLFFRTAVCYGVLIYFLIIRKFRN